MSESVKWALVMFVALMILLTVLLEFAPNVEVPEEMLTDCVQVGTMTTEMDGSPDVVKMIFHCNNDELKIE